MCACFLHPAVSGHPCQTNNAGCSNLCLLSPGGGYKCVCPTDYYLTADNKQCMSSCTASQVIHLSFTALTLYHFMSHVYFRYVTDSEHSPLSPPSVCLSGWHVSSVVMEMWASRWVWGAVRWTCWLLWVETEPWPLVVTLSTVITAMYYNNDI